MATTDGKPIALFIDDDEDILPLLKAALLRLSDHKVEVLIALSGPEGLDLIDQQREAGEPVDVIFLDINMAPLDGLQMARLLTGDGKTASIPLFTLSGFVTDAGGYVLANTATEDQRQHVSLVSEYSGVLRHLVKPVKTEVLLDCIYSAHTLTEDERQARIEQLISGFDPQGD